MNIIFFWFFGSVGRWNFPYFLPLPISYMSLETSTNIMMLSTSISRNYSQGISTGPGDLTVFVFYTTLITSSDVSNMSCSGIVIYKTSIQPVYLLWIPRFHSQILWVDFCSYVFYFIPVLVCPDFTSPMSL